MASKASRGMALFLAFLFLATSSVVAVPAIMEILNNGKSDKNSSKNQSSQEAKVDNQNKLTGTTLQGFTPVTTRQEKLETIDTKIGDGQEVKPGDTVTADYVGALMSNGRVFDASADHGGPVAFPLSGVIAGWSQGIPGMKVGGTRRLLIPANLGYGSQGSGSSIPPDSDLVFDVTITKIGK